MLERDKDKNMSSYDDGKRSIVLSRIKDPNVSDSALLRESKEFSAYVDSEGMDNVKVRRFKLFKKFYITVGKFQNSKYDEAAILLGWVKINFPIVDSKVKLWGMNIKRVHNLRVIQFGFGKYTARFISLSW